MSLNKIMESKQDLTISPIHLEDAELSEKFWSDSHSSSHSNARRAHRVAIYWLDDEPYYVGASQTMHCDGAVTVRYDDRGSQWLNFENEVWKFAPAKASLGNVQHSVPTIKDTEPRVLTQTNKRILNKPFLKHQVQELDQLVLVNAYGAEEQEFFNTVQVVSKVLYQPVKRCLAVMFYRVKQNESRSFKCKARIAPDGSENDLKLVLTTECSTCTSWASSRRVACISV